MDDDNTPRFGFASGNTPVADSGTPSDIASPEEIDAANMNIAVQQANEQIASDPGQFNINVDNDITSDILQGQSTFEDVNALRAQREATETSATSLNDFDPELTGIEAFDDPEQTIRSLLFDTEMSQAEQQQQDILQDVSRTTTGTDEALTTARERAEDTTQIGERQSALAQTNEKLARRQARFRREQRALQENSENRGVARAFFQDEVNKLEADAVAEIADLSIIQQAQQGNVEAARSYINTAVDNRYRSIEIELKQKQAELDALIPTLQNEQKQEAQQLQIALNERQANLANEKEEARNKRSLMLEVAGLGGGDSLQNRILNAPTEDQAAFLASSFIGREMRNQQALASQQGAGGFKAPTIKEINGVDYQWNEQFGIWEEAALPGTENDTQDSLANLDFLLDVTDRILGTDSLGQVASGEREEYSPLYKGASQSPVSMAIAEVVRGTSKQARLEAQVDTLRSQMLTLATDPSIKQFFGPQMSDADVKLMTAAGTTLRPGSQSESELQDETIRIQDFVNRARTAVVNGTPNTNRNLLTAPDGTVIEIVD